MCFASFCALLDLSYYFAVESCCIVYYVLLVFVVLCVLLIKHYSLLVVFDRNFMSRLHKLEGPLTSNPWDCSELGLVSVLEP